MKQLFSILAGAVIAAGICFVIFMHARGRQHDAAIRAELAAATQSVQTRLDAVEADIASRLAAFARSTVIDQIFALRLIAENNPTAPEVTGRAAEFLSPMGFTILDITDSSGVILSSGSFIASAGNPVPEKLPKLSPAPVFIKDKVVGVDLLTLQAKAPITIADSIRLYALGGTTVDSAFLALLAPRSGVAVLLRRNGSVAGWQGMRSISDINNDRITIDGKKYPAAQIPIPVVDETSPTALIVVLRP